MPKLTHQPEVLADRDKLQAGFAIEATASVNIEAAAGDAKPATFRMDPAYSGGPMRLEGFFHPVALDFSGAILPPDGRLPIRLNHSADAGVGHSTRVAIERGRLFAEGVISRDTEAAREVVAAAKRGFPWRSSVGARAERVEFVKASASLTVNGKKLSGPLIVARQWTLGEISFVDRGADDTTAASIAAQQAGTLTMPQVPTDPPTFTSAQVREINALGASLNANREVENVRARILDGEISLDAGREIVASLERMHTHMQASGELATLRANGARTARMNDQADQADQAGDIIAAAYMIHAGYEKVGEEAYGARTMQKARDLRAKHCMDIMEAAIRMDGRPLPDTHNEVIRASFSTNFMTSIADGGEKLALAGYNISVGTEQAICHKLSLKNFLQHTGYKSYTSGRAEIVGPTGELKHIALHDSSATVQLSTFGLMAGVTRQDIINDSLGLTADLFTKLGRLIRMAISDLAWEGILASVGSHYAAGNLNYTDGAATALSDDSLAAAIQAMREQVDPDDKPLALAPKTLFVPPALERTGKALLQSSELLPAAAAGGGNANPYKELSLEVEPRLANAQFSNYSDVHWILSAATAEQPHLLGYLNGREAPVVEVADAPFNTLGMNWRGYIDVGFALGETTASYYSKGEA